MKTYREFMNEASKAPSEAQYIRTKLKKDLGLSNKDVSVKTKHGGLSSAVTVSIKSQKALALKQKIEAIGQEKESYQTDRATGEILMGGNTFVFTKIDTKFKDSLEDIAQKEFEKVTKGNYDPEGKDVVLYKNFVIGNTRGTAFVFLKGASHHNVEIRDMDYVGMAIMSLIGTAEDDSLYAKIK